MVFDASVAELSKNVADFSFSNGDPSAAVRKGYIIMSLGQKQNVPGVGTVKPNDLIAFRADDLGADTAGTFQLFMDGSDVGLSTKGEQIDGLDLHGNGNMLLSTTGSGNAPTGGEPATVFFNDEDIVNFNFQTLGANTNGSFNMALDGSEHGLASTTNIRAIWSRWLEDDVPDQWYDLLLLTFDTALQLDQTDGSTTRPNDAIYCLTELFDDNFPCHWSMTHDGYDSFDGGPAGLSAKAAIDGIDRGSPYWPAGFATGLGGAEAAKLNQE
jgi:hypothetical protein